MISRGECWTNMKFTVIEQGHLRRLFGYQVVRLHYIMSVYFYLFISIFICSFLFYLSINEIKVAEHSFCYLCFIYLCF